MMSSKAQTDRANVRRDHAPTLVDVAREAGVSLKTASRVLNEPEAVSENRVTRTRAAMKRLGYRPNELARGLKSRKSSAIGMIVPNLSDPFFSNAIQSAQEEARKNGYVVVMSSSNGYPNIESSEIETLARRQIDGLVIAPAGSRTTNLTQVIPAGMPVVTFDEPIDEPLQDCAFDTVTVTNRAAACEATEHMLGHGAKHIVAIGARPHLHTCAERVAGYREAMLRAGATPRAYLVQHEGELTAEWLRQELFANGSVDAIFTLNWVCTILVLKGLRELDKKVGRDILLVSFDDFDLAGLLTPSLTAVRQPSARLGVEAMRLLFERLRGGEAARAQHIVLPTELILRESCGCRKQ